MISTALKCALCALKLIVFATILYLAICILAFPFFIFVMSLDSGSCPDILIPELPQSRDKVHNTSEPIINDILITPAPKEEKKNKAKKQPTKQIDSQQKTANKPLEKMTSKELLAHAKAKKIKGYSAIYRKKKKSGLVELIKQQPEFS